MGWWSDDILGGDSPLDIHGFLTDKAGLDYNDLPYPGQPLTGEQAAAVARILPADAAGVDALLAPFEKFDKPVARHVLAVVWMQSGAPMPDDVRAVLIAACDQDDEGWAGNPDRVEKRTALAARIRDYTGEPQPTPSTGLFDSIRKLGDQS